MLDKLLVLGSALLELFSQWLVFRAGKTSAQSEQMKATMDATEKTTATRTRVAAMDSDAVLKRLHECWRRD